MKKFLIFLAAAVVLTGIIIVSCHRSNPDGSGDFESFGASILDYDYWKPIHDPGIMGPGDVATLVVGKIGYEATEVFPGKVTWSISADGVLVFVQQISKSEVAEDGLTATGNIVEIRAIGEGTVTVLAKDAAGNVIQHEFKVAEGQHYTPDGEWKEPSYSSFVEVEYSSSLEEEYYSSGGW